MRFIQKFCVDEVLQMMTENEVEAMEAVRRLAERWEVDGRRPVIDRCRREDHRTTGAKSAKSKLGILKPKIKEGLNKVGASEWKMLKFCLDSGAGEIVMAEDDLPEVETTASWGASMGRHTRWQKGTK